MTFRQTLEKRSELSSSRSWMTSQLPRKEEERGSDREEGKIPKQEERERSNVVAQGRNLSS